MTVTQWVDPATGVEFAGPPPIVAPPSRRYCPLCAESFDAQAQHCPDHGLPLVESRLRIDGRRSGSLSGRILDNRYRLGSVLGKGGMGIVYEGENLRTGRIVAVKLLHGRGEAGDAMDIRLFREVQATSRIAHPNVIEIYDYGQDARAGAYLVMEYLPGESLGDLCAREGRLPLPLVCKIGLQLAAALAATHAEGLVHRDLKPSNVRFLPDGTAKILDFGLVKSFAHDEAFATLTTGGFAYGTPAYMSPEQARGLHLDPRSDLYALGVVLYELLSGRLPYIAETPVDLWECHRHGMVPLFREIDPALEVPLAMELLVLKLLRTDRRERLSSATAVLGELHAMAEECRVTEGGTTAQPAPVTVDLSALQPPSGMTPSSWVHHAAQLRDVALAQFDTLVDRVTSELCQAIPRLQRHERKRLTCGVKTVLQAGLNTLFDDPQAEIPERIRTLIAEQHDRQLFLTEILGACLLGHAVCRPTIWQAVGGDWARYEELALEVDRRLIPFYLRLVDHHLAAEQDHLARETQRLGQQNQDLGRARDELSHQVRIATRQLAQAEELKRQISDLAPIGLLLFERGTRRILLFNRAMERIAGLSASQVIGRRLDDILHLVDGLPLQEFLEQLRLHNEVGLRKLSLSFADGPTRWVYVRGAAIGGQGGERQATLFTVEDVTEREQLVQRIAQHVPAEVLAGALGD